MIRVERYHDISCGHRVFGHEGKCQHLHGHNYRIRFVCEAINEDEVAASFVAPKTYPQRDGGLDALGRVIDFGVIKSRLCAWVEDTWDHRMLLWSRDPLLGQLKEFDRMVVSVPFNPTAENIARYLVLNVGPELLAGLGVRLVSVTVEETRKCSATFSL
jgi:6-pyruvoyltetrahydropterin/6-carboxytetrahydropterin synthase